MKKYLNNKLLLITGSVVLLLSACKKEENQVIYQGGTAPVLTASVSDTIPLVAKDSLKTAVILSWTNPNYQFSNGISSMNVTYYIEIDTLGANFTSPNMQTVAISGSLSTSFTEKDFNTILAGATKLNLSQGDQHNIQVRVVSFLGTNQVSLASKVLNYVVTPYAPPDAIAAPSTYADNPNGNLFIVGAAVSNWDNPIDAGNLAAQTFTKISNTEYKITIALTGGGEYKLIGKSGSWGDQWSVATTDTYPNGGPFVFNGNNCIAPAASGTYTIDVNFHTGLFTVTQ